ncbi:MAG TPA: hypothetical protein VGT41_01805 [Candidatus Babeliales bacterium]|nr:hypothetical protein [Candidatus Babeliales bacterium]
MNSISKKIFLAVIAGAALQAGNSAYGASQLGGLYKSGATVALATADKAIDVIKKHGPMVGMAGTAALAGIASAVFAKWAKYHCDERQWALAAAERAKVSGNWFQRSYYDNHLNVARENRIQALICGAGAVSEAAVGAACLHEMGALQYAINQVRKNGPIVCKAITDACKGAGKMMQKVMQHEDVQQEISILGGRAAGGVVIALVSCYLAAKSVKEYRAYQDALKHAQGAKSWHEQWDENDQPYTKEYWLNRASDCKGKSVICGITAAFEAGLAACVGAEVLEALPVAANFAVESAANAL